MKRNRHKSKPTQKPRLTPRQIYVKRKEAKLQAILNPPADEPQARWRHFFPKDQILLRMTDAVVEYGPRHSRRLAVVLHGQRMPRAIHRWIPLSQYRKVLEEPHFATA